MFQNRDTDKGFPNQNYPPYAVPEIVALVPPFAVSNAWQSSDLPHEIYPLSSCPVTQSRLNLPNEIYLGHLEEANIMEIRHNEASDVSHHPIDRTYHYPRDNSHIQTTYPPLDYSFTGPHELHPHSQVERGYPLHSYPFDRSGPPDVNGGTFNFAQAPYLPPFPHQTIHSPEIRLFPAEPSYALTASDQIGTLEQHTQQLDATPQATPDFSEDTFNTLGGGNLEQLCNLPENRRSSEMPQVQPPRRRRRVKTRLSQVKVASLSSNQPQSEAASGNTPGSGSASPALSEPGIPATDQTAWIRKNHKCNVIWFDPHHEDARPLPEQKRKLSLFQQELDPVTKTKRFRCSYIDPVVRGSECRALFSQQCNWYRHLRTVHGKKEKLDIQQDVLTYEYSVALKDVNVLDDMMPVACPDYHCTYFIKTGIRWHTFNARPERDVERHKEEYHPSSNDSVLDVNSGRPRKKRRLKYVRLYELLAVYMPSNVEGNNHASVGDGGHPRFEKENRTVVEEEVCTVVEDEDYASVEDEDIRRSC